MTTAEIVNRIVAMFPKVVFLFITENEVNFQIEAGTFFCMPRMDGGKPRFWQLANEKGMYDTRAVESGKKLELQVFEKAAG